MAVLIRLVALLLGDEAGRMMGDSQDYVDAALALVRGAAYPESASLPYWRPPGYPFAIAAIWAVLPQSELIVLVIQSVLDGLGSLLLAGILIRLYGNRAAVLGQLWYALYPPFIQYAITLQTETWFQVAILALTALLLVGRDRSEAHWPWVSAGVMLGIATLFRPVGLLVLPGTLIVATAARRTQGWRVMSTTAVILTASFMVTLLPWMARNHSRYGEWVLVNDAGWFSVWLSTTPAAQKAVWAPHTAQPDLQRLYTEEIPRLRDQWLDEPFAARSEFWKAKALEALQAAPGDAVRYRIAGIWHTWRPWLTPGFYSSRSVVASFFVFAPTILLGWAGLFGLWRSRPASRLFLVLVACYALAATASNLIGPPVIRYRVPLVDALFIGMASAWLVGRLERWSGGGAELIDRVDGRQEAT